MASSDDLFHCMCSTLKADVGETHQANATLPRAFAETWVQEARAILRPVGSSVLVATSDSRLLLLVAFLYLPLRLYRQPPPA